MIVVDDPLAAALGGREGMIQWRLIGLETLAPLVVAKFGGRA